MGERLSFPRVSWLSVLILVGPLALFGELLITTTHHRPLGAATFATVALLTWLVTELVVVRLLTRAPPTSGEPSPTRERVQMVLRWIAILGAAGLSSLVVGRVVF